MKAELTISFQIFGLIMSSQCFSSENKDWSNWLSSYEPVNILICESILHTDLTYEQETEPLNT